MNIEIFLNNIMLFKFLVIVWYENGDEIVDELNNELIN